MLLPLLAVTITLPFLLRRRGRASADRRPFRQRLRPHYWLGYGIAALVLLHAAVALSASGTALMATTGVYLANGALLAVVAQVFLGLMLREQSPRRTPVYRRWHLWVMMAIVVLALGHIALSSPLVHTLLRP